MSTSPRVRFAPSPTGYLHVGGARTALFNWLYARHEAGAFILRIEDTDRERSRPELTEGILEGLRWLGLDCDEGPFHQADFLDRHRADAERLLESGHAYRCFCTAEELEERRRSAEAAGETYEYEGRCRSISAEESERRAAAGVPFAIRFRMPEGRTSWDDGVHGVTEFDNRDIEDFVILRTDGTPTYNLAVVSDDIAMRVTHVIRGDDHLSNTPKQIRVYHGLGHEPPAFSHVPLILGPDGKRLSKRHGATAVSEYRTQGYLQEAMVNFLALLGWSPGDDRELFDPDELIAAFSLEGINRKSAIFDHEKLLWLNGEHLKRASAERVLERAAPYLIEAGVVTESELARDRGRWLRVVDAVRARARTLRDFEWQARPYGDGPIELDPDAVARHWKDPVETADRLERLRDRLAAVEDWRPATLEAELRGLAEEIGIGAGKLIHPLRVALTGMAVSPGIFDVLELVGRDLTMRRIGDALAELARRSAGEGASK